MHSAIAAAASATSMNGPLYMYLFTLYYYCCWALLLLLQAIKLLLNCF